jgi:hypothetical protein
MQERVESDQIEHFVVHKPLDHFFINSLAFHNAHLLRATLPRDLLAPLPLFLDRQQKHHELAAQLRNTQSTQLATRKAAAEKQKRGEEEDDENGGRPKKKRRTKGRAARKVVPVAGSMVANRGKRKITQTQKALATPSGSEEETAADSSDNSDPGECFDSSDSEYLISE